MKLITRLTIPLLFLPVHVAAQPSFTVERKLSASVEDNLILTYQYTGRPTSNDIAQYVMANKPKSKEGHMTAAYFFPQGSTMPEEDLTKVTSIYVANEYLYNSPDVDPWQYAVIIHFNQKGFIVNCAKSPLDDYCRKARQANR